jgi:hypothetical protein
MSDEQITNVIAHEFAHVASGLPTDPKVRNTSLCEDRANQIMRWWGFQPGEQLDDRGHLRPQINRPIRRLRGGKNK